MAPSRITEYVFLSGFLAYVILRLYILEIDEFVDPLVFWVIYAVFFDVVRIVVGKLEVK